MFELTFKNIDDILHKDAGCTSELDYTEQSSWLLFLKYLDALEHDKAAEAELEGKAYTFILTEAFRWDSWAAPKTTEGKLDHNAAMTGDDLRDFVDGRLFPYLAGFKQRASGPNTIEYKIGEVFGEIKNKVQSGYNLRDVIDLVDELRFRSQTEKHELSHLYEAKIKNMGNAGRNGGEYYTPRPLIRAMIKVLDPKIGERIYDGACGSAGFLCEAFDHLLPQATKADDLQTLQTRTFYGREKKSLAYVIAIMNMILHGIEAPNVVHANTLADNISDMQDRDRYDVILANPPFGGKERKEVQQNSRSRPARRPSCSCSTSSRRCGPAGARPSSSRTRFSPTPTTPAPASASCCWKAATCTRCWTCRAARSRVPASRPWCCSSRRAPTRKVWFYQLNPGRSLGKTNSLNDNDLVDFIAQQKTFADSAQSWSVDVAGIDTAAYDLSVKNPNGGDEVALRTPQDILDEIATLDAESAEVLSTIRGLVA